MSGFSDVVKLVNPAPELDFVIASGSADPDQVDGVTTIAVVPLVSFGQNTTLTIPDPGVAAAQFVLNAGSAAALTAHSGGGQANALALTASNNVVTTVAAAADSVALPLAVVGKQVLVANQATTNSLNVYTAAAGTDTINALTNTTAFAIAAGASNLFFCVKSAPAGLWITK